jgi:hypothetical protein
MDGDHLAGRIPDRDRRREDARRRISVRADNLMPGLPSRLICPGVGPDWSPQPIMALN